MMGNMGFNIIGSMILYIMGYMRLREYKTLYNRLHET